ncbi:LarC family nickel insertion protein [Brachybacterium sp. EE-P12]|uniref:Pyridinium-3,5-bisthiocarboxylic acid mononucleotide nickel insertion protein n=1 Tax=Candidatus Brachybacterium intestinipullorum TaxID=2838512 RepID=A0A9D2Q030_9MICO|nr:LarC family nickel insertion protein [Brachybacterium sp. EE-P12]HJC68927.1 LarC family nickel insertion protein [Candidatus Brachybacterium intestinipullorum]
MDLAASRHAYIDATAGIAGDMLLAALVDAGADLDEIQRVLDALIPGSVRLVSSRVDRGGQRAVKVDVEVLVEDPPHRTWSSIRALLEEARGRDDVPGRTLDLALAVFGRLAEAEGATHGVPADEVHFHEVGALDSLADVIGACEAWRQLGIAEGTGSVLAVGSGRIRAAHGDIPVPVPAVARLALGWPTVAGEILPPRGHGHSHDHHHADADADAALPAHARGGPHEHGGRSVPAGVAPGIGELATPTGVALLRGLAASAGPQPMMTTEALGVGAGTKDTPGRPNVVRVLVGRPHGDGLPPDAHATPTAALQLEANVDDLDPRLWPRVIEELLETGALDAWLVPISMKHGRPAVTVHALVREGSEDAAATLLMDRTGTLGVRRHRVERVIRTREFTEVEVRGHRIAVKIARDQDGAVVRREPEFRDVAAAAWALGISERTMLDLAREAAAGLAGS